MSPTVLRQADPVAVQAERSMDIPDLAATQFHGSASANTSKFTVNSRCFMDVSNLRLWPGGPHTRHALLVQPRSPVVAGFRIAVPPYQFVVLQVHVLYLISRCTDTSTVIKDLCTILSTLDNRRILSKIDTETEYSAIRKESG